MSFEVIEAVDSHSVESGAQPLLENLTPRERMILRFYRQLDEAERVVMMRMLEALTTRTVPPS
ncbi:hypothetical protein [Pseudomonas tohonis]|uniref:Transcriptional regulator n=1 Tax=Pseudomonas tohonis TaxID=2725477 RepID=A0ABQ4W0V8_9PSED|nr:hypothetical protein [Pseudomonas tohonis]GJN53068.1 hypothetical protein TUM20286_28200 [Pseudomonas tohonis]